MLCTICTHDRKGYCAVGRNKPQPVKCESFQRITRDDIQRKVRKRDS